MRDATFDSRDSRLYSIIAFSVAAVVSSRMKRAAGVILWHFFSRHFACINAWQFLAAGTPKMILEDHLLNGRKSLRWVRIKSRICWLAQFQQRNEIPMISPSDVLNIWDQEEAIGKKSISGSHDSSGSNILIFTLIWSPLYFQKFGSLKVWVQIKLNWTEGLRNHFRAWITFQRDTILKGFNWPVNRRLPTTTPKVRTALQIPGSKSG